MAIPMPAKDFKAFLKSLNSNSVEYLLIGGCAVGIRGHIRATNDLDGALRQFGFAPPELTVNLFLEPNNVVRRGVPPIRIEILTTISGVEFESCFAGRQVMQIEEPLVPAISLSRRRENKAASGRAKDLADLDSLAAYAPGANILTIR